MYAIYIYGNIYHPYTPNVSIYTIHGSYGILLMDYIYSIPMEIPWNFPWNPTFYPSQSIISRWNSPNWGTFLHFPSISHPFPENPPLPALRLRCSDRDANAANEEPPLLEEELLQMKVPWMLQFASDLRLGVLSMKICLIQEIAWEFYSYIYFLRDTCMELIFGLIKQVHLPKSGIDWQKEGIWVARIWGYQQSKSCCSHK